MKRFILTSVSAAVLFINGAFAQLTISGVKLPEKLGFSGTVRELNGGGTRVKFFVHAYVAGLYLKEKTHDAKMVVNADKPMSVRLQIISAMLTSDLMVTAIREGFKGSLNGKIEPFKEEIDMICSVFSSEPTKVGDVYDIHYTPGVGITASKNGKAFEFSKLTALQKSKAVASPKLNEKLKNLNHTKEGQEALPGLDFKKAVFGIWFSDRPVDEDLKDAMLAITDNK